MVNFRKVWGNRGIKYCLICFCFQFFSFVLSLSAQNPPAVMSVSPSSAAVGATITITGTDFNTDISKNIVFFGATKATVLSATATELAVTVPAGATHDFITVLDLQTGLLAYSPNKFLSVFDGGGANASFAAQNIPNVGYANEVILGDFNNDGKADIACIPGNGDVYIHKNTSQPRNISFASQVTLTAGGLVTGRLATADFNGDGKLDLVVSNYDYGRVSVFVNTSTGSTISFAARKDYSSGSTPLSISINDMDGDGRPDIVIGLVLGGGGALVTLANTSTQADVSFVNTGIGIYPGNVRAVYAGDLDNDRKPDVAVFSESNQNLSVYRNTSSPGAFSYGPRSIILANTVAPVNMVDMDLDGKLDIITGLNSASTFDVLRNTSTTGSISVSSGNLTTMAPTGISGISTNDFNGDGKIDIGISNQLNNIVTIIQGNSSVGSIQYGNKPAFSTPEQPVGMASADLDGDGKPDLVVAKGINTYGVSILRNTTSAQPTISTFAPLSAGAGSTLTVTGTNLDEVTAVTLGGTNAASFNVLSSTAMIVTVGTGSSGTLSVTAVGGMTSMSGFVFVPAPTINVFAPVSGMTGTVVTIAGTNFTGATAVSFGGVNAISFTVLSPTRIQAVVAGGNSGAVAVQTPGGTGTRSGFAFQPAPTISSISPSTGPTGTMVTITGNNFIGTDLVGFGGTDASFHTVISSTTVRAWVGPGSSGNVTLRTPSGSASYPGFVYKASPYISSITPTIGKTGATITVTGYNFTGITAVSIGGTSAASFNVLSSTTLTAVVGAGASGAIAITNSEGTGSGPLFGYLPASPIVNSFSPLSAAVGSTITITGNDFNTAPSGNIVFFGATRATVVSASATQLSVLVPSGASHAAITVLNSATGLSGYSQKNFLPVFNGAGADISFASKKDFIAGANPFRIATSDFDNDGKPDMAVIKKNVDSICVFRNTSVAKNISFSNKTDYWIGAKPNDLTIGDVNGDGKPDIIVGKYNSKNVSVLINTSSSGAISFAFPTDISLFVPIYGVQENDFDLDGNLDVAVTKPSSNFVTILNYANQIYPDTVSLYTPGSPMFLCVGDLDDDGKPDIATINQTSGTVSIYRNTSAPGIISFAARNDLSVTLSGAMSLGDIDGDGKADLILSNQDGTAFEVLRNTSVSGSISFSSGNGAALSTSGVTDITTHDFNGDGKIDIAISSNGNNAVSVIQNNSTPGSFLYGNTTALVTGSSPQGITSNDIDGDGKPDLLVVNSAANTVSVFRNTASIPPVISSFAPLSALQGATLTVTGSNFDDIIDVQLGGISAASFNVLSSTMMTVVVGGGASGTLSITSAGGTAGLSGFTYLIPPAISSISPASALSGTVITITGTNFTDVAAVSFGGTSAASFTILSSTTIEAVVGNGSSGSVAVQTAGGIATKTGFVYLVSPTITSISPSGAISGTAITITGTDFTGVTAVSFGGSSVASFTVISSTVLSATVGNGSSGSVTVQTSGGIATKTGFIFLVPPTITSVSPSSALSGTAITITGTDFTDVSAVSFGGTAAASFTVLSSTTIEAVMGNGSSGSVAVQTAGGIATKTGFVYLVPPTITSVSPSSALSGTAITITGTDFTGLTAVSFGGTSAASFTVLSSTAIRATVGSGSSGSVIVQTVGGTATKTGFIFLVPPTIMSVSPSSALSGTAITITGADFMDVSSVSFGGVNASSFNVLSSTIIEAVVGNGGSGSVAVQTAGGIATKTGFVYLVPPTVTSFSPSSALSGTAITITGTDFTDVTAVSFGGTNAASFNVLSSTTIEAVVGSGSSGSVIVETAAGTAAKSGFVYLVPPTITSISPSSAFSGTAITITGADFTDVAVVSFGGVNAASFSVLSSTTIEAVVGSGSSGSVAVQTVGGIATKTGFVYLVPPTVTSFSPSSALSGTAITITGTDFTDVTAVSFGGTSAVSFTVLSSTVISATLGNGSSGSLTVQTAAGTATKTGFVYLVPPVINSFEPLSVAEGALLTITGANFENVTGISLGGVSVASFTVLSSTVIEVTVGNGSSGSISVTTTGGTAGLNGFVFLPRPAITTISPDTAVSGTTITITGTNFTGVTAVSFGGVNASSFTVLSPTVIQAVLGNGASGPVEVQTTGGIASQSGFVYLAPPIMNSFTPLSARQGTTLTITGANFENVTGISLGGVSAASFTVLSSTAIEVTVGNGSSGTISVTTAGGTASMNGFVFLSPPLIDSVSPRIAVKGTVITITGTGFTDVTGVSFGGVNAASFTVLSSTVIEAVVGNGASGFVRVEVAGATALLGGFQYLTKPVINSFAPLSANSGEIVSITGHNFNNAITVSFGGINAASFSVVSSTLIQAMVSIGSTGKILVQTPNGLDSLDGFVFTGLPPDTSGRMPLIESFEPVSAGAGASITITGSNLSEVTSVILGGSPVTSFNILSPTTITAVISNGSTGDLIVVSALANASKPGFVYIEPVKITGDSLFCPGDSVVLRSTAATDNQWYRNDIPVPGATTAAYTVTTAGKYKVITTNPNALYVSNTINVKQNAQPVATFTLGNASSQCLSNNNFNFVNTSNIPDNSGVLSYRWSFGDNSIASDLEMPLHTYSAAGSYGVKLVVSSNIGGCKDSALAVLTVIPPPALVVSHPPAICNTTGALTVDITNPALYAGSDAGLSFSFWKDTLATQAIANATSISVTGRYYVKAVSASGCFAVEPVQVTLNALPVVAPITGNNSVCIGAVTQLNNTTTGGTWSSNNPQSLTIDNTGLASGKQPGNFGISYSYTDPVTGCSSAAALTVTVNPLPIAGKPSLVSYVSDTVVCFNDALTIAANGTYDKYLWSTGATSSSVTINDNAVVWLKICSNQSSCYSETSVVVTAKKNITPKPVVSRQGDNLVSSSSLAYKWLFNSNYTGDIAARIPIAQRGAYAVNTSADGYCWNMSDDYIVFFDPVPVKKVFDLVAYPNPTNGNFNLQLTFDNNITAVIKITMVNQSGIGVWSANKLIFNDKSIKIPVSVVLVKGVYTIGVEVNGETVAQQLIIM